MNTLMSHIAVVTATIFACTACQNVSTPLSEPEEELVGSTWQLVAFEEGDGEQILVEDLPEWGRNYTVVFRKQTSEECGFTEEPKGDWCMRTSGHPNEGLFTYDLGEDDRSLTIHFHGQTQVGTPSGAKEIEFFDALKAAKSYRINGTQLRIDYGDNNRLLLEPKETKEEE